MPRRDVPLQGVPEELGEVDHDLRHVGLHGVPEESLPKGRGGGGGGGFAATQRQGRRGFDGGVMVGGRWEAIGACSRTVRERRTGRGSGLVFATRQGSDLDADTVSTTVLFAILAYASACRGRGASIIRSAPLTIEQLGATCRTHVCCVCLERPVVMVSTSR